MPPISGIGTVYGISEESTYGTADSAVDNYLEVEEGFESLETTREVIEPASLHGRSLDKSEVSKGRLHGSGDTEVALRFDAGWPMILAHLTQKAWATTGAGPYTHTLDLGATPDMAGKGITQFVNRQGLTPAGGSQQHVYIGCRPTACDLVFPETGLVKLKTDWMFKSTNFGALTTPTFATGNYLKLPSNASSPTAFFTWAGTTYIVRGDVGLRIEQPYQERWTPEDDLMLEPALAGLMKITMSLTVEALATASSSGGAFYDDYKARTFRAAILTVDGPTPASESFQASFGDCLITSPVDPHPESGETQLHNLEITAYRDGATSAGQLVLINGSSAAYAA